MYSFYGASSAARRRCSDYCSDDGLGEGIPEGQAETGDESGAEADHDVSLEERRSPGRFLSRLKADTGPGTMIGEWG